MKLNDFSTANQPIIMGSDSLARLTTYLKNANFSNHFILVDSNTKLHCLPILEIILSSKEIDFTVLEVEAGEESKDLSVCASLWQALTDEGADRKALLINLGGGMICDLGAFVASVYKRGISFINVPSSLLAMVDASIGGKCGIDFDAFKNQLGLFNTASLTVVYIDFLASLNKQEMLSGYAEMLKHSLISDVAYWNYLSQECLFDKELDPRLIEESIRIKSTIVSEDPLESGSRKKLNFGHTIGHALESYFLDKNETIPHGYAVAAGIICETYLSAKVNGLSEGEKNEIVGFIVETYPKLSFNLNELNSILTYLKNDKKNEAGKNNFSILDSIGDCSINKEVDSELIKESLVFYCGL